MSKRLTFVSAAALAIGLALPLHAQETSAETVIATVNGTEIKLGHLIMTRRALPEQYQHLAADILFPGILDQIIQQIVLEQSLSGDLPTPVQFTLDNQRRATIANAAIDVALNAAVTDASIQAEYDMLYAAAPIAIEYNAAHILVKTKEEAQALSDQARDGADFGELAKEHSTGPSGPSGGSLGWFGPGMMVKPFEDAVKTLEAGGVSDPVETQFGWHVIKLNETRQQDAPTLDQVRDELSASIQQKTVEARIQELTSLAEIDRSVADGLDVSALDDPALMVE